MNLSPRERQVLRSIEGGLAESSPDLVAKLAKLSRLMLDSDTPAVEQSRVGRLSSLHIVVFALVHWLPHSRGRGHTRRQARWVTAMLALWLAVSGALVATAASLSHVTSAGACGALVAARPHCASQSTTGPALPGAR